MAKLDALLTDAETVHRQTQLALRASDTEKIKTIVQLRTHFGTLMAEIIGAIRDDPRLQANPALGQEFANRFGKMRQSIASHQANWRSVQIDEDPEGYRAACQRMIREQDDFYTWARDALAGK